MSKGPAEPVRPLPAGGRLGVFDDRGVIMLARVLKTGLGVVLMIAGVAMLILPGPGLLVIAFGLALVLSQSPKGQRTLARLRVRLRDRYGSSRVRTVESRLPNEVCPPVETRELRELAENPIPPPRKELH